jgi:hypothetical protein
MILSLALKALPQMKYGQPEKNFELVPELRMTE